MNIKTARFGELEIGDQEVIRFPQGILGFPDYKRYTLVDSGDDSLILWLQCLDNPALAFPVLEPKIFFPTFVVRLSPSELRELQLESVNQSVVFSILTIPEEITSMTANIKAPIVVNLKAQTAKQVVLQESEYGIKHAMFKELKTHLLTLESRGRAQSEGATGQLSPSAVKIPQIPPSLVVKSMGE